MPHHAHRVPSFLSLAALALAALPVRAQQPQPPAATFGEKVEVAEALIDVLVTDRDGNVVLGLRPGDFRVEVGDRPAEVTGATFYSNRRFLDASSAEALGLDPGEVPDRRLFVLFLDDQRIESLTVPDLRRRQRDASRVMSEWLRRELLPNDLVAVVSFDSALRLQQDFTHDLEALEGAVERASRGEEGAGNWASRRSGSEDLPSLAAGLPEGEALGRETPEIHRALTSVGRALEPIPGRKNLILLTTGFGEIGTFGNYRPDVRYHEEMIETLNAANVAVYPIDLMPSDTRHTFQGALTEIAASTGGEAFLEVFRFERPFERIAKETNGYYLVSVRVPADAGGGYRDVDVGLANPEFRVRARTGLEFREERNPG